MTTSRQPSSSASLRFSIAISMNVAGRKIEESMATPGRRRLELGEGLLDAAGDVEGVGPRELLDDQQEARRRR